MLVIDTSDNTSANIASLQARGVTAVGRYYSSNAWKRLTAQEARSVSLAGIKLFTVFEDKGDPELTIEKGVFDGQIAKQQARAIGQPEGSAIYFALEHLPHGYSKSHVPGAKLYIEGVRQAVAGLYAVGVYSNGVVLEAMLDTGLCEFAWLSASRAFEGSKAFYASRRWVLAQDPKVDQNWGGLSVDINEVQGSFGAFGVTQALVTKGLSNDTAAFSGEPKAVWLTNSGRDRTMRIVEDFWFRDRSGKVWEAPAGTVVDGASIPSPYGPLSAPRTLAITAALRLCTISLASWPRGATLIGAPPIACSTKRAARAVARRSRRPFCISVCALARSLRWFRLGVEQWNLKYARRSTARLPKRASRPISRSPLNWSQGRERWTIRPR